MEPSLFEYKLEYDARLELSDLAKAEAYKELATLGRWTEDMWWQPLYIEIETEPRGRSRKQVVRDAGFRVIDKRIAEDEPRNEA